MPIDITMPALSPTMEKGTLAKWRVAPGEEVRTGDIIAEVETDKATMEIEAADNGFVHALLVGEGAEDIPVGHLIAQLVEERGDLAPQTPNPSATVVRSPANGALTPVPAKSGPPAAPPPSPVQIARPAEPAKASPLARRLASAKGINLSGIRGTGPNGRIMRMDVIPVASRPPQHQDAQLFELPPLPDSPHDVVKLSGMRKTIARRLAQAKREIPHFYLSIDVRVDALLALRAELNAALGETGPKLSVNDLLIKALALALIRVPDAHVQFRGDELIKFRRADVAVAVAIDGGLVTPVIHDAGAKSISAIATEARDLAAQARAGTLKPEDYQGGTATLSNLGMYGIKEMVPVLNPPQALILGAGTGERRPYAENDTVILATVMTATGSFDHRAIDGVTGAKLMAALRFLIEKPLVLLT